MSFSPLSSSLVSSWFVILAMTLKHALRHIYDVCRDKGKESRSGPQVPLFQNAITRFFLEFPTTVIVGFV